MKSVIISVLLAGCVFLPAQDTCAQPVPVEFMAGSAYASINVVMSKSLAPDSRFGFFHLNTMVMDWQDREENDLTMQNLLFFEPVEGFRLTGGAFYATRPGFHPTAGMQYINAGRKWFVLLAPRVNIEQEPTWSIFSILRFKPALNEHVSLYTSLQLLHLFDAEGHIKSYQWMRVGVDKAGTQFGFTVNLDESGPSPEVAFSAGVFVRREIF